MKYISLVIMVFLCMLVSAQNKRADSLLQVYNDTRQDDTNRLQAINTWVWMYMYSDPDTSMRMAEKLKQLASRTGEKKYEALAWYAQAVAGMNEANYAKALGCSQQSLKIFESIPNKKGVARCYSIMGVIYAEQANYTKALEYDLKSYKLHEELGMKADAATNCVNLGIVYSEQHNYAKALEYHRKALQAAEHDRDSAAIGDCYSNIGIAYYKMGEFEKALEHYNLALKFNQHTNNLKSIESYYSNIAAVYVDKADYKKALEYTQKSAEINKQINDQRGTAICYGIMLNIYGKLKNYRVAILYGDSALKLAKEIGDIDDERLTYGDLAKLHETAGNYKSAYENHIKFKQLTDSIFNTQNSKELGDLKTQFEVDKKETELRLKAEAREALNAEEKQKQQIIIYAVIGVLLLVLIFSTSLFNRYRVTQKQKKIIEEQKVLVDLAYEKLHEKNKEVLDSINYASRIQRALITSEKYISVRLQRLMGNN